jgi:hypothetical protein
LEGVNEMNGMEVITIGDMKWYVVKPPAYETILKKAEEDHMGVCDFKMSPKWNLELLTDSTTIPAEARKRIAAIESTGVEVEWYIAHEVEPQVAPMPQIELPNVYISQETWNMIGKAVLIAGAVFLAVWVLIYFLPFIILGVALLGMCFSGDPAIVARVRDEKGNERWIDCFRFYGE